MSGAVSYHSGYAAEDQVARCYERDGARVLHQRWRRQGGEIDLVMEHGGCIIFVEVKQAKSFANAADRVSHRQIDRIRMAAAEYLGVYDHGMDADTRFDVALVDGRGGIQLLQNAF